MLKLSLLSLCLLSAFFPLIIGQHINVHHRSWHFTVRGAQWEFSFSSLLVSKISPAKQTPVLVHSLSGLCAEDKAWICFGSGGVD